MLDRSKLLSSLPVMFLTLTLAVCAVVLPEVAVAQSNRYSGQAFEPLTNTYFHLQYEGGDDWAQGTQQAQFGGTRYVDALNGNGLWLNYGQFGFDHNGHHSLNAGVVRRFWLGGGIVGLGGHYDLTRSNLGNDFQKAAVTGEWFSSDNKWIVRGEGNFAVGPDSFVIQDLGNTIDELFFQGNNLMIGQSAGQLREEGMSGLEYELARALGNYAAEGYLGGYHYLGQVGDDANGIKGGVRGFVSPGVFANLEVREDNVFGTSLYGGVTLFLGGPSRSQTQTLADQMIMPVQRHDQAIVNTVDTRNLLPDLAVTQGGNVITFTHVDNVNTGAGGDAGTFENPFTSLVAASGSTSDIVYVHSGTTFVNDGYEVSAGQRFLGEGGGNQHQLMTDQLGLINLPEVNGINGARPILRGASTPILVTGSSEISNFDIDQASRTLMFDNVAGNVDVNRLTGSGAIYIDGGSGDYTFSDVHIVDSTFGGMRLNGGSANITFDGIYGGSSLSVLDDYAVMVQGSHSGTILFPTSSSITATDTEGFLFLAGPSGSYIFNGTNTISNDGDGGIQLANSGGTYVFGENTSITNTGDGAVLMNLSGVTDLDFTYSGTIQNFDNRSIDITGGLATGQSIVFDSTAEDAIQDSAEGISISGTNANVTISADTELTGSRGVFIGVSDGTHTFTDTDIELSSGTRAAMQLSAGSGTVNFGDDSSILNITQDRAVILVENGHTGTLNMEGVVGAAAGDGIVFDNADGTYNFNGTTSLDGTTRGIDVGNGSSGTFAFSENTAIANTTNEAIRMDLANANNFDFTYSGTIQNSTGRVIDITGGPGTGQSVLFNSTAADAIQDSGAGIWISDTDADVNIQADTELTGSNGVTITDSTGTYTFADTDINLSSGSDPSLSISGGSSDVNFGANSSITNEGNRSVVSVDGGHTGTLTMDGTISSTAGDSLVFDNADGTYNFNGTTTINGANRGIQISNGSEGTFTFSEDTSITNVNNIAVQLDLTGTNNFDFTYSGTIENSLARMIDIEGGSAGQSIVFNSTAADALQDTGDGIWISNTAADVELLADTELTGNYGLFLEQADGTYTFADTDITDLNPGPFGNSALWIRGGSATVNFEADSSITTDVGGNLVMVEQGHSGTLNMDGSLASTVGGGLVFNNADGTYNFNGTTTLDGTDQGIQIVNGSEGTFVFSEDTSISNTTNDAIEMTLVGVNTFDFTYSGTILNTTGRAIDINGGPAVGQSILFNSTADNAIQDSGEGISIANSDANVNIQADTELTGSNGVAITDSDGTYTFADTDINLSSGTDPTLSIDGGSSTVNFGANSSITNGQNRTVVNVEGGHTGTLTMDGNISSTAGDGIVFDNADGTYNFNGTTSLDGTARGIYVTNGSSGTFTFSEDTSIANTVDSAVELHLANADNLDFTYSGTIQNSTGMAIGVLGGPSTGQSVLFNSTAADAIQDSGQGIVIANTNANVNIQSDAELTGTGGVTVRESTGTYTFADTDIAQGSAGNPALWIDGGSSTVNFGTDSSITHDQLHDVVRVENGHTGTLNMDGAISANAGNGILFDNADGTYNFSGTTNLDGTARGIDVANGSAGTFAFSENTSIANTTNEAIRMDLANADNLDFTYSGTIQNSTGRVIDISGGPGTGQSVLFNSTAADAIQDSGEGIWISDTDADVNIQADTELTGSNGVTITDSDGTYTFADTDINLSSGTDPLLSIDGGSSTVNFGANSSITNGQNRTVVNVEGGHTGTLTMDGNISSTAGDGLAFDNADGTYNFNGTTNLNGTSNGIQIANGSSGTFTFSNNTSITDPLGGFAYQEEDSTANVTYNGTITQNNNSSAVYIMNKTGGTTTFNGLVTANTSNSAGVFLDGNTGSTVNFSGGLDIDTNTGVGLYAKDAGTVNITGNGNSIYTVDGRGVYIENTTAGMTFDEITVLESSAGFDAITLKEMSGSFEVTGTTTIGSAGDVGNGIFITSGTTEQAGTIAFGDVSLGAAGTGGTGRAISVDGSNQTISFSNTSISGNWGAGADVRYRGIGSAGSLWFDELNNTGTTTGRGLTIQNSAGNVTVNSGTIAGQASNALDVEGGTGAVTIFADVVDLSGGGNVVSISGRSLTSQTINIMGDVTGTGGGILVDNNTGGTINFTGDITMSGERGLYVDNNSGTTVNFSGPDSVFNNRLDAVTLINNAATTSVGFNSGNLNIDSNLGSGINASGAGSLSVLGNGNTIDAYNDDAIVLDGVVFRLNNTWVGNGGAFYTIDTANSTLSGSGNIAPVFSSRDGGGNAGVIEFNGGLDFAP